MQITIDVTNENLFDTIFSFLNQYSKKGVRITQKSSTPPSKKSGHNAQELDFSSYQIDSFKSVDGLAYQKEIRDAW